MPSLTPASPPRMNFSPLLRIFSILLLVLSGFVQRAGAVLALENAAAGTANAAPWLLDAEPETAAAGAVHGRLALQLFNPSFLVSDSLEVEAACGLEDEAGAAVDLQTGGTQVVVSQTCALAARVRQTVTLPCDLRPVSLDPLQRYRVSATLRVRPPGGAVWTAVPGVFRENPGRKWVHFTNTQVDDASSNVKILPGTPSVASATIIRSVPGQEGFTINVPLTAWRYDLETVPVPSLAVPLTFTLRLFDQATSTDVPLAASTFSATRTLAAKSGSLPAADTWTQSLSLELADWSTLDPTATYIVEVSVSHAEPDATPVPAFPPAVQSAPGRLLGLSGTLRFGGVVTTFTQLGNNPSAAMAAAPGGGFSTQLAVSGQSGTAASAPGRTYGNGALLAVAFDPATGDASVTAGTQAFSTPDTDIVGLGALRFVRTTMLLNPAGALLNGGGLILPAGCGVSTNQGSRRHVPALSLGSLQLADDFSLPFSTFNFTPPAGSDFYYVFVDRLPVRWRTTGLVWDVAAGTLQFTQAAPADPADPAGPVLTRLFQEQELAALAPLLANPAAAQRWSNDAFLGGISDQSPVTIGVGATGSATLSVSVDLAAGQMTSHFPAGVTVSWSAGRFTLAENQIVAPSYLDGAGPVSISHSRDCPGGCGTNSGPGSFAFTPLNEKWAFTADGGLWASGAVAPQELGWGSTELKSGPQPPGTIFAHKTSQWTQGAVHVPGTWLAGSSSTVDEPRRPAALLLSGALASGEFERPDTPGYLDGLADYAGLNLRAGVPGALQAYSVLAGVQTPVYSLKARCKYYVRSSGVTGIHEAAGLSPSNLLMYGFNVNLDGLRLAYLDGENVESKTGGAVHIPDPVRAGGFDLEFSELKFLCRGQPGKCTLATGGAAKTLAYWGTDIVPLSMEFKQPVTAGCASVASGFILVGARTKFPSITPQSLHASLGFDEFGNLVTQASDLAKGLDVDSRFTLPASIQVAGAGEVPWEVTITGKGYLNNPRPGTTSRPRPSGWLQPQDGFLTFPATINAPWFEDMKVQLHVSASSTATSASIFEIMGGWPANPADGMGAGWRDAAGQSFFTNKSFDPDHIGFPVDSAANPQLRSVEQYRDTATDLFNPRAQKRWLGVVDFDFPLVWEPVQRRFHSNKQTANLVVLGSVDRQVKSLSPSTAELTFGVQFSIPRLNAASLAAAAMEQLSSVLADALQQTLGTASSALLTGGMNQLDGLLAERLATALTEPVSAAVDPVAGAIVTALGAGQSAASQAAELSNALRALPALGLLDDVDARLQAGESAIQAALDLVAAAPDGSRNIVRNLAVKLVRDSGIPGAGELADMAITAALGETMPKIDGDFGQAEEVLRRIKALLGQTRGRVASQVTAVFSGASASLLAVANASAAEIDSVLGTAEARALLSPPAQKERIKRIITERLMASTVIPRFQTVVRQHVQDLNQSFRAAVDDVIAGVNHIVREVISKTIDNAVSGLTNSDHKAVGGMGPSSGGSGKLAAFNLEGYAQINDESLRVLDINGKFEFNVPDSMKVQAHLRIEEFDANTPATGCRPPGSSFAVVTVDAQAQCDWIGTAGTTVGVGAKFSLQDGSPVGFDGSFDLRGEIALGPVVVKEARLIAGFGSTTGPGGTTWAYVGAKVRGSFNAYEAAVGMFLGRCCTVEPIALIDPEVAKALGKSNINPNKPITGVYFYGEAWIPLNEVYGIPSTCLFTVRAGAGAGFFAFVGTDLTTGGEGAAFIGCKQFFGVEGTFLCIFSIHGEMTIIGAVSTPGAPPPPGAAPGDGLFARAQGPPPAGAAFILYGQGKFSAQLGACPFCLKVSKSVGLIWSIGGPDPGLEIDF